ncbi:hypothetical protein HDU67_001460 [Dinochytrium kinnereticum]|nr:hypothetical protein HDU67_001460 [Dinochytrium kinnereticum]
MRESKKIFSRTFLVIINLLAFLTSIGVIILGAVVIKSAKSASEKSSKNLNESAVDISGVETSVYNLLRAIGITLIIYGSFILLTATCGFFGACTRRSGLLSCYISSLVFDVILTLAVTIYTLVVLIGKMNEWDKYTVVDWNGFNNAQKDYYQLSFGCCGFDQKNNLPYLGESHFVDSNNCTTAAIEAKTYLGCQMAGHNYYYMLTIYNAIASSVVMAILLASIGAAHQTRKREFVEPASQPMVAAADQKF